MDKKKITNMEVKKKNRNDVFRYICKQGTVSNPEIAVHLNMSLPTATQITKELIEEGFVEDKGELQSTGGRRAKALSAAADVKLAVGLDITRNHIALLLANLAGDMLEYERIYQPYASTDTYYREISDKLESFLDGNGVERDKVLGVGISFPGIVDLDREMIADAHVLGVENLPFAAISRFFPYPCSFMNDANAGAFAEGIHAEEAARFFYLSLSNTVGGAVFDRKELIQGKSFRCGEAGHMTVVTGGKRCYCGKKGCLDSYCAAGCLSEVADGKLEHFFRLLDQGKTKAIKAWDSYTDYLAIAVNNIHMLLDCEVVLGGYVGSYMGVHIQDLWEKVAERNSFGEKEPFVRACSYKETAAALGASLKVVESFVSQI